MEAFNIVEGQNESIYILLLIFLQLTIDLLSSVSPYLMYLILSLILMTLITISAILRTERAW